MNGVDFIIFIAHSLKFQKEAEEYEKQLGEKCYIPGRDTKQDHGDNIIIRNRNAMELCSEVHVIWDGVSQGTLVDIGMAYGMHKPIKIVKIIPRSWGSYLQTKIGQYL